MPKLFAIIVVAGSAGFPADTQPPAIAVDPPQAVLAGAFARTQLRVSGSDAAGRAIDLTGVCRYESLAPAVLAVSATGQVRPLADGSGAIRVKHGDQSIDIPFTVSDVTARPAVSFREDVIPVLSKAGCNQGACHAAQYGQGGLKLSVFAFAPDEDHRNIVRDWMQRRISPADPGDSLILRKATLETPHGGGRRFDVGSYEHDLVSAWIRAGAPGLAAQEPEVVGLSVSPADRVYATGESQQLRVVARYSDGSERDVTHVARYDSLSDAVNTVSPAGQLTAAGHGQAGVMVRYQGQAKVSIVEVPTGRTVDLSGFTPNNFVDELVAARWRRLGLQPSGPSNDAEFVRRAFLDAIGTLPPPDRVRAFLASSDPDKRAALVDELLGLTGDPKRDIYTNEWSAYWALKWGDLLRNNRNDTGDGGMWALYNWTRRSLRENKPVDQFVREIITAQGSIFENGPANYYRIARDPAELAETTAQVFLGVRLMCAKCHHHPFEVYGQSDYYGLAAFFTRVGAKSSPDFGSLGGDSVVMVTSSGDVRHPRTGAIMQPTPLQAKPIDPTAVADRRRPLAEWLTAKDNRLFAQNVVNRFWAYLMGAGLVEPIDDMRATNPATNPELLDALAADFVAHDFDIRRLMRVIMTSRVYGLSSIPTADNATDTRFYTHYSVKRLPAEVLLDAIDTACGTREKFPNIPLGTRAIELPDPNYTSYFLDTMGRPQRVAVCECERTAEPNLAQVLQITNGDLIARKLTDPKGRISQLIADNRSDADAIAELYWHVFGRAPTAEDVAGAHAIIGRADNRREGLEDLMWAMCNCREFLFNH